MRQTVKEKVIMDLHSALNILETESLDNTKTEDYKSIALALYILENDPTKVRTEDEDEFTISYWGGL